MEGGYGVKGMKWGSNRKSNRKSKSHKSHRKHGAHLSEISFFKKIDTLEKKGDLKSMQMRRTMLENLLPKNEKLFNDALKRHILKNMPRIERRRMKGGSATFSGGGGV
jgi:hypothetical protein